MKTKKNDVDDDDFIKHCSPVITFTSWKEKSECAGLTAASPVQSPHSTMAPEADWTPTPDFSPTPPYANT